MYLIADCSEPVMDEAFLLRIPEMARKNAANSEISMPLKRLSWIKHVLEFFEVVTSMVVV